ncbi:MAG TPA: hypothetical protein VLG44_01445 [Chlamydiales bacterium]|nr:hypothetical protein [Chlamydiales bacterium]
MSAPIKFTVAALPSSNGVLVLPNAFTHEGVTYDLVIKAENEIGQVVNLTHLSEAEKAAYFNDRFKQLGHQCLVNAMRTAQANSKDYSANLKDYSITLDTSKGAKDQISIIDRTKPRAVATDPGLIPSMTALKNRVEQAVNRDPTIPHKIDEDDDATTKQSSWLTRMFCFSRCCKKRLPALEAPKSKDDTLDIGSRSKTEEDDEPTPESRTSRCWRYTKYSVALVVTSLVIAGYF